MEEVINPIDLSDDFIADDLECPVCGNTAVTRHNLDTAEEQIDCYSCGYTRQFVITNLDTKDQASEFEWIPKYDIQEQKGFGAYAIRLLNSENTEVGSFATEQSEQYFINSVEQLKDQIAYAKYTKFVDGKLEQVILINTVE